jgi:hypothetical protein
VASCTSVMPEFWPASSQRPILSSSATARSFMSEASSIPVMVLVVEPISKRPSSGQSSLSLTAYPPASAATAATTAVAGSAGLTAPASSATVADLQSTSRS